MGKILRLFHPQYAGLQFGPNSEIKFGARAGLADNMADVDEDDPLLPLLLEQEPSIVVLSGDSGVAQVFPCPFEETCGHEPFKTKQGVIDHLAAVHGVGDAAGATESDAQPEAAPKAAPAPRKPSRARPRRRGASRPAPAKPASPSSSPDPGPGDGA